MIPVDRFEPAPLYQPSVYPGSSPAESFLHLGDTIELLGKDLDPDRLERELSTRGHRALGERQAVLCSGSHACPAQVRAKLADLPGNLCVPFLLVELEGAAPVFAAHASSYGVIPATLDDVGVSSRCHLAYFTERQLTRVNASEGPRYELCRLEGLRIDWNGIELEDSPLAYLAKSGVLCLDGAPAQLAHYDQRSLLESLFKELGSDSSLGALEVFFSSPGGRYRNLRDEILRAGLWRPHRLAQAPIR